MFKRIVVAASLAVTLIVALTAAHSGTWTWGL
jgi:hypothetical protein